MSADERFAFGMNWRSYLARIDDAHVGHAENSLRKLLRRDRLDGVRFLDIGCGSGMSSLVARRLGARVQAFDYDSQSVSASRALKARFRPDDDDWIIDQGSVLDPVFMGTRGRFDIVHAWGVLHHTGDMWQACSHAAQTVAPGGSLALAIYNDQGGASQRWARVKRAYVRGGPALRAALTVGCVARQWGRTFLRDLLKTGNPLFTWRRYGAERCMSAWHDAVDWVGGWPFEVATPEAIFNFHRDRGFVLEGLKTCGGGLGCNEFLFRASSCAT
jgi:SAM-dependent methyltransferase